MTQLPVEQIGPMAGQICDVRMGRLHPSTSRHTDELVGELFLALEPDHPPRWR